MALKAENLQRTGSFKIRGVVGQARRARRGRLPQRRGRGLGRQPRAEPGGRRAGARHPVRGVRARRRADVQGRGGARAGGDRPHRRRVGRRVPRATRRSARASGGLAFVHPFDDPDIVAGQGSLGLELLEDVPDLAKVIVPVGGGGLCSGVAIAVKAARPDVEVVGVQAAACSPYPESLRRGEPVPATSALTIADGIAVKRPGRPHARPARALRRRHRGRRRGRHRRGDGRADGALQARRRGRRRGRRGGAAGRAGRAPPSSGTTVAVLSGGNVDPGLLAAVARRHESQAGRRLVMITRVPDRPGNLATLLGQGGRDGRQHRRRLARARGARPARARDRGRARARDARPRARRGALLPRCNTAGYQTRVLH